MSQLDEARALLQRWFNGERDCAFYEVTETFLSHHAEEAPEGMVLVPREPTKAMLRAAEKIPAVKTINAWCAEMQIARGRKANWTGDDPPLAQAYRAMLAAYIARK